METLYSPAAPLDIAVVGAATIASSAVEPPGHKSSYHRCVRPRIVGNIQELPTCVPNTKRSERSRTPQSTSPVRRCHDCDEDGPPPTVCVAVPARQPESTP